MHSMLKKYKNYLLSGLCLIGLSGCSTVGIYTSLGGAKNVSEEMLARGASPVAIELTGARNQYQSAVNTIFVSKKNEPDVFYAIEVEVPVGDEFETQLVRLDDLSAIEPPEAGKKLGTVRFKDGRTSTYKGKVYGLKAQQLFKCLISKKACYTLTNTEVVRNSGFVSYNSKMLRETAKDKPRLSDFHQVKAPHYVEIWPSDIGDRIGVKFYTGDQYQEVLDLVQARLDLANEDYKERFEKERKENAKRDKAFQEKMKKAEKDAKKNNARAEREFKKKQAQQQKSGASESRYKPQPHAGNSYNDNITLCDRYRGTEWESCVRKAKSIYNQQLRNSFGDDAGQQAYDQMFPF